MKNIIDKKNSSESFSMVNPNMERSDLLGDLITTCRVSFLFPEPHRGRGEAGSSRCRHV